MTNDQQHNGGLIQITKKEDVCPGKRLTLAAVREKIDAATAHDDREKTGPEYWRSLEELAGSEEFQQALHREFPKGASEWLDTVSRRGFLKVMGASLGLAGMYLLLAGLATPLVLSVHTVVSFDFAIGIVPGWHTTIFPPYFVAGAIYSGFAMVLMLAIPIRKIYGLEDFITERHLQNSAKVMDLLAQRGLPTRLNPLGVTTRLQPMYSLPVSSAKGKPKEAKK